MANEQRIDYIFKDQAQICKQCRVKRKEWKKDEQKFGPNKNKYSNFLGGVGKTENIDIFIISDAHGGGKKQYDEDIALQDSNKILENHYLNDNIITFYQKEMRQLFKKLDEKGIRWYASDLVKCFVKSGKKLKANREIAEEFCFKNYLEHQIKTLNPKIILLLGGAVINKIEEQNWFEKRQGKWHLTEHHGETKTGQIGDKYPVSFIFSLFPSKNTADRWVKCGEWDKVIKQIDKIRGL